MSPSVADAPFLRIAVEFGPPEPLGEGPPGPRRRFTVATGRFDGPGLAGKVLPGGTDCVRTRPDGVFALDIRMRFRLTQGGVIAAEASGILDMPAAMLARLRAGGDVPASDCYFRTLWRFEADGGAPAWLTRRLAIGVGARTADGMVTELFALG